MCGIFGIVQPGARPDELVSLGQQANVLQAHRGPDHEGLLQEEGWLLAHRRLAIFDISNQGKQPLQREKGLRIVFNGAVYNFPELRDELRKLGHHFASDTDTEVVLAAYQAWGMACFARFNGMWAIAIIDTEAKRLVLSRDRVGIKPLYLHTRSGQLAFASETYALRQAVGNGAALNLAVAEDFLLHGWQDHRPETLWEGIRQFPAGHFEVYALDTLQLVERAAYVGFPKADRHGELPELQEEFLALLTDSVRLRTRSDVGYGLTLSGGIDSSAIAGLLPPGSRTYSVRFPGTVYDESRYVDAVVQHRALKNDSLTPGWASFVADCGACQFYQDQPLASAAVVAHFSLMRLIAGKGEKVILNGQGADEIGAGYDKFYAPYLKEKLRAGKLAGLKAGLYTMKNLRLAPDQLTSRVLRLSGQTAPSTFFAPALRAQKSTHVRLTSETVRGTSEGLLTEVGLPVLLRHVDRNTMAFGIEGRPPFLDYRIVDFLLSAPLDFKIRYGIRKWGIRESVKPILPQTVYARKRKLGFATPQVRWMEANPDFFMQVIRAYCDKPDALLSQRVVPFFEEVLRKRKRRYYPMLWRFWAWGSFFC